MMLINVRDDLIKKLMEASNSLGKPISDYLNELFEQALRAHSLNCSLKETIDLYERTIIKKEAATETERVEEPAIDKVFERALTKLKPEISKSEEYKMLSKFLSQIPER